MSTLNKLPFFSVIIPLYNKEKHIKKTLDSVMSQTFKDFEIIIINDGSTDNSYNIVKQFNDPRLTVITQENQGLSCARNNGIEKAEANYLTFIDADDFWYEHHLQQLHDLINTYPNNGLYSTGYTLQKTETIFHRAQFNGLQENFIGIVPNFFKHSLQSCIAWVGSICIPKKVFSEIGGFDPEIYSEQDTDLYIRIALKYKIVLDDSSVSAIYNRTMDDNMSNFSQKKTIPKLLTHYKSSESKDIHLKKFMDLNRFSTLVFFKLSSNTTLEKELLKDIDFKNLNRFQKLIIKLPNSIVKFLFFIKDKTKINPLLVFRR